MYFPDITYYEPVFRPPSEAYSLILQATIGCSWNQCAFCEMYSTKKFRITPEEKLYSDIENAHQWNPGIRKVFIGDGNAMVLSTPRMLKILNRLNQYFPKLTRISAYSLPKDLEYKSQEELNALREAGLKLLYVGIESGDDDLLKLINKGETRESTVRNLIKAKMAGMKISAMIINGLGGTRFSKQHAESSAKVVNLVQPDFLSTLVLSFPFGSGHYKSRFGGFFEEMDRKALLREQLNFIAELNLENTVFRSDHASNYLVLKGNLPRDKVKLIREIETAIQNPENTVFRQEWQRGL
jgi:radical SAM superfamily enzyme YgiQ (UPF0313 family)